MDPQSAQQQNITDDVQDSSAIEPDVAQNETTPRQTDGTLNYMPPSIGPVETTPSIPNMEVAGVTESNEQEKTIEAYIPPEQNEETIPQPTATIQPQVPPLVNTAPEHVVDLRTGHEPLQHIEKPLDKITSIADHEEEEFIKEVEKHHEHK